MASVIVNVFVNIAKWTEKNTDLVEYINVANVDALGT